MKSLVILAVIGVCSASYQANSGVHHGPAHSNSHAVVHTSVSHGGPSYGHGGSSVSHGGPSYGHVGSSGSHGGPSYGHGGSSISHAGSSISHGGPSYGHGGGYAPYSGPLASSVPAGIGGKVIPVSDTYEVAAARDAFFRAYDNQLATINAIRYNRAGSYGGSYGSGGPIQGAVHGSFNGPAGRAVSYSHGGTAASFSGPAASYGGPTASYGGSGYSYLSPEYFAPARDTPEVAAAKAEFFKAYDRQAAAAAAAPDNYVHY